MCVVFFFSSGRRHTRCALVTGVQRCALPISENPWLHLLTVALGRWQNGVRVFGVGMALASISIPQIVEAANIADANGWKAGGVVTRSEERSVGKEGVSTCRSRWSPHQ